MEKHNTHKPDHSEQPAYHPNGEKHPQFNLAPKDRKQNPGLRIFSSIVFFFLVPVLIAIILTAFVIQSYQVDGESMETTLQNHDRLVVDKLPRTLSRLTGHQYVPKRGNIIVFNQTGLPDSFYQKQLIKRVVGLPGERVIVSNGQITVYNKLNPAGFNPDTAGIYKIDATNTSGDIDLTLGHDEIFVFGDNRDNSEDSRYFGPVKLNNIVGTLAIRILPINKTEVF
jgi:signal peptidase I